MSKEDVSHKGVIQRVERDYLVISTEDDCTGASDFSVGERVEVTATSSSTLRATWWALILPTLIFGGVVLGCRLGFPALGGWSIAIGFAALGLYDLFLYAQRRRLAQKISWKVRRIR